MRDEEHLSEETLNRYLDGELSSGERERVVEHAAACEACRAEMLALQALFVALEELTPVQAPNLSPDVLAQIWPRRRVAGVGAWLVPLLQGAIASLLLAWGWARLMGYWTLVGDALPLQSLQESWSGTIAWLAAQGAALLDWPTTAWNTLQGWFPRPAGLGGSRFTLVQLASLGIVLLAFWLIGNAVLLRRVLLNGHVIQKEALR